MKQTIEIEVPDGKKAVWKDGHIVFKDIDTMESIKTIEDAEQFLLNKGICKDILYVLHCLPKESFEWKIAAYRTVVAAITYNEQRHLTTGERWFPTIEFCLPEKLKSCCGNIVIGQIESERKEFYVVSGCARNGSATGLGHFYSGDGVSFACTTLDFHSVGSKKAAMYISKQFGKLLFEISYGGVNCNWE